MYGCELLYPADDAATIREELGRTLGLSCPCPESKCPLLPLVRLALDLEHAESK